MTSHPARGRVTAVHGVVRRPVEHQQCHVIGVAADLGEFGWTVMRSGMLSMVEPDILQDTCIAANSYSASNGNQESAPTEWKQFSDDSFGGYDDAPVSSRWDSRTYHQISDSIGIGESNFAERDLHGRHRWPHDVHNQASRPDGQVSMTGSVRDVERMRTRTSVRDTAGQSNRASLKVDVSFTDHSHMIGIGGKSSKQLSYRTNCHIHFPDCNKQTECDKSNCVSVSGEVPNIEYARIGIRLLQPLVLSITLPQPHPMHCHGTLRDIKDIPEPWRQYIELAENRYGVKVNPKPKSSNQHTALFVKGSEENSENIQAAAEMLVNELILRHYPYEQGQVTTTMEVSTHHHRIVQGNIRLIMQRSGAVVLFPDAEDKNIPLQKKGSVIIMGQVRDVYSARQMLIGSLPVKMTFEVAGGGSSWWWTERDAVRRLEQLYDVSISLPLRSRPAPASTFTTSLASTSTTSLVSITAMERNVGGLYNARQCLLGVCGAPVVPGVPESYTFDGAPTLQGAHGLLTLIQHSMHPLRRPSAPPPGSAAGILWPPCQPAAAPATDSQLNGAIPNTIGRHTSDVGVSFASTAPTHFNYNFSEFVRSPLVATWSASATALAANNPLAMITAYNPASNAIYNQAGGATCNPLPTDSALAQFIHSATSPRSQQCPAQNGSLDTGLGGSSVSPVHSNTTPSVPSTDSPRNSSASPQSRASSQSSSASGSSGFSPLHSKQEGLDRRAPGCEKKLLLSLADYDEKRALAAKLRRVPVEPKPRTPTDVWSGYGFSRSSPYWLVKESLDATNRQVSTADPNVTPEWARSQRTNQRPARDFLSQSNMFDCSPSPQLANHKDLISILENIDGLKHYSETFRDAEIDLPVFLSMTEDDLKELGIRTVGARKKLCMLIQTLTRDFHMANGKLPL